ncbi:hypothetical protein ETAA8_61660 [Anatilimnocola aggregata]|uniref:Uncharacterized protein n=1 Tax=Anatilimnocola aggregata TaxID=2528021 RepID=A0A517YLC3_9BACT|nr:hypothetical protein [Anatilimnocola aggregata]QDU31013.1 hypothetical protein ETAA8_61660 [Anatilimnocola aggregata]
MSRKLRISAQDIEIFKLVRVEGRKQKDVAIRFQLTPSAICKIVQKMEQWQGSLVPHITRKTAEFRELSREQRLYNCVRLRRRQLQMMYEDSMEAWRESRKPLVSAKVVKRNGVIEREESWSRQCRGNPRMLREAREISRELAELDGLKRDGTVDLSCEGRLFEPAALTKEEMIAELRAEVDLSLRELAKWERKGEEGESGSEGEGEKEEENKLEGRSQNAEVKTEEEFWKLKMESFGIQEEVIVAEVVEESVDKSAESRVETIEDSGNFQTSIPAPVSTPKLEIPQNLTAEGRSRLAQQLSLSYKLQHAPELLEPHERPAELPVQSQGERSQAAPPAQPVKKSSLHVNQHGRIFRDVGGYLMPIPGMWVEPEKPWKREERERAEEREKAERERGREGERESGSEGKVVHSAAPHPGVPKRGSEEGRLIARGDRGRGIALMGQDNVSGQRLAAEGNVSDPENCPDPFTDRSTEARE